MIRENYQVYSEVEQKSNQGENLLYNKEDGTINRSKVVSVMLSCLWNRIFKRFYFLVEIFFP